MRKVININDNWTFVKEANLPIVVDLPHTWNNLDGTGGTPDYFRGECIYIKQLPKAVKNTILEFNGANSVATVYINDMLIGVHKGGYSTFRFNVTDSLRQEINTLKVVVNNADNKAIYPTLADFTFYGGLYRDVNLIEVEDSHFILSDFGSSGIYVTPTLNKKGVWTVDVIYTVANSDNAFVTFGLKNAKGKLVYTLTQPADKGRFNFNLDEVTLWNGVANPYLYTLVGSVVVNGKKVDEVSTKVGFRTFKVDSKEGFYLNGNYIKLKGVSRHQDREQLGNALSYAQHEEDIRLIAEMGANSIRLAHYQHNQDFYDLCDKYGMLVWAEVPVISNWQGNGEALDNAKMQMIELIKQNYNHSSIFCWGIQNEITISGSESRELINGLKQLNKLVHTMDKTRLTTQAQVSMLDAKSKLNKLTDILAYNHYFGWYAGSASDLAPWLDEFHKLNPKAKLGLSEYGCEAILKYQLEQGKQFDYSENYQSTFHETYIKEINARKWLWGSYVWNMFDFGSAMRDEGGVKGRNNKGLVTFDRKIKKDSYFIYKAYWADEKFVHICGSRYVDRATDKTSIKVYSNCDEVTLKVNGNKLYSLKADRVFIFDDVQLIEGANTIVALGGNISETITINRVAVANADYLMTEGTKTPADMLKNWFEINEDEITPDSIDASYYSVFDTIGELAANKEVLRTLNEMFKGALKGPMLKMVSKYTIKQVSKVPMAKMTPQMLEKVNAVLQRIKK